MTRGLYKELIEAKDEVQRLRESRDGWRTTWISDKANDIIDNLRAERDALRKALKNSALHALYQGHRADDAEVELSEQNETIDRLRAERDALRERVERQHKGLKAVEDLINESDGVYGYHLNGDLSPWGDFLEGGCNETYLMEFEEALEGGE
jgi:uncharacterized coiled-coil DUF342 family protein